LLATKGVCFIVKGRRYRYIYFISISKKVSISFKDLNDVVQKKLRSNNELVFPKRIRLIQFNGATGIIRCAHHDQHHVIDAMNHLIVSIGKKPCFSTQGCSGTIRALRKKYGVYKEKKV
jgi:RNase P/RNase MRP subunit POP5